MKQSSGQQGARRKEEIRESTISKDGLEREDAEMS